jgi:flagellin-like hook-associated protein FlgL
VQTRQDFTNAMVNTLEQGASDLTLADVNKEGANMLALQTSQQLATSTMGMASRADQAVLSFLR